MIKEPLKLIIPKSFRKQRPASTSTWVTASDLESTHERLPIRQIYVWVITKDEKVVIVGNNNKYQFPGGKPERGEDVNTTLRRELFEETGLQLNEIDSDAKFFGYYVVDKDMTSDWKGKPYLQLRFILMLNQLSTELNLSNNEPVDDMHKMTEVKLVELQQLPTHIPWTVDMPEYEWVLEKVADTKELKKLVTRGEVFERFLEVSPDFRTQHEELTQTWIGEEPQVYTWFSSYARHLIAKLEQKDSEHLKAVFKVVEELLLDGNQFVREAVIVGLLEDIQNGNLHNGLTKPEDFRPFLLQESELWWDRLYDFWLRGVPLP